ncbi:hypothetical protein PSTT_06502, partial [Puccinia striiformis]
SHRQGQSGLPCRAFCQFKPLLSSLPQPQSPPPPPPSHHHLYHHNDTKQQNSHLLKSSANLHQPSADHEEKSGREKTINWSFNLSEKRSLMNGTSFRIVEYHNLFNISLPRNIFKSHLPEISNRDCSDPTHGLVNYQRSEAAWNKGLVILQPSSMDKNFTSAIMKVDNYTFLADRQNRNSVRLTSKKSFKYGLVILDVMKMPFGCSTWPAFWTVGENWPHGGEIDIVEGVNMGTKNQMTLHTAPGCKVKKKMSKKASGKVLHTDCDSTGSGKYGCGVADRSKASLGKAFNDNGGGVFVMEWKKSGISVWRFNRTNIPKELAKGEKPRLPNGASLRSLTGTKRTASPNIRLSSISIGCSDHLIPFNIMQTLCGDWAGAADVFNVNGVCPGNCSAAVKDPSVFKDAYWVDYQAKEAAWKEGLVIVQPSSMDKNFTSAIMKVDNYTFLEDGKNRKSVRLTSKKSFKYGLVILDVMKMPFGCSTWPAFWTVGESWPQGGEIDIVEGVNMGTLNQMTLHSVPGCKVKDKMSENASGKVIHTDCDATGAGNIGCGVTDPSSASLGKGFNDNGGGVFVMEWKESGISIWRFNRTEIPEDLAKGENPQPSKWSNPPISHWAQDDCNSLSQGFSKHKIVFDITLCGDWAGAAAVFNANGLCSGSCSAAVKDPAVFKDAYWEVASVKLYQ